MRAAKGLSSLRICADLPNAQLLADAIHDTYMYVHNVPKSRAMAQIFESAMVHCIAIQASNIDPDGPAH